MLHIVANGVAESVKEHLTADEDKQTERDMTQRPAVLESVHYQHELHDEVHGYANGVQQVKDDKHADGIGGTKSAPGLEGQEGHQERDSEHDCGCQSNKPHR